MIENDNYKTLNEIFLKYPIVLIDTSVLCGARSRERKPLGFLDVRRIELDEQMEFMNFLKEYVEEGAPCFITPLVAEEYLKGNYHYKRIIKSKEIHQNRKVLDLCRKTRDLSKKRKSLINAFREKNRILELSRDEQDLYNTFHEAYPEFLDYGIGDVDLDFFISGEVISATRKPVGLVCNDFGIAKLWRYMLRERKLNYRQLGFIIREGVNSFEILD